MEISECIKKRLTLINLLCLRVSINTEHDASCDYSGNVNSICVFIHEGGFASDKEPVYVAWCVKLVNKSLPELDECIAKLEGYLK